MTEAERIDPADLRTALGTCMHDKDLQQLFKSAPDGAKKVLKLSFYSTVFPDKIDGHKFRVNLREIEPELTAEDLQYLIRFETNEQLKAHFKELLEGRTSAEPSASEGAQGFVRPESKVRLIRPAGGAAVDLNAEAIKRKMAEDEAEKAAESAKEAQIRQKASKDKMLKIVVSAVVVLAVLGGGIGWFLHWDAAKKEQERLLKLHAEEERLETERQQEEKDKAQKEQNAAERKKREEQAKQKDAERKAKREAEQQARKEEDARREAERELREKEEAAAYAHRQAIRDEFDRVESLFQRAKLVAWSELSKEKRPGEVDGTFFCVIPVGHDEREYFKVDSKASGEIKAMKMSRKDDPAEIDFREWTEMLNSAGGIVHNGTCSYLFVPKAKPEGIALPQVEFRPAQLRLGMLEFMLRALGLVSETLATEVVVSADGIKGASAKFTVKFRDSLDYRTVREGLRTAIDAATPRVTVKAKRRTAMFYDGNILKKQMNGVVLVPRKPLRHDANYDKYRDEAERQEREAERAVYDADGKRTAEVERRLNQALETAKLTISIKF